MLEDFRLQDRQQLPVKVVAYYGEEHHRHDYPFSGGRF